MKASHKLGEVIVRPRIALPFQHVTALLKVRLSADDVLFVVSAAQPIRREK